MTAHGRAEGSPSRHHWHLAANAGVSFWLLAVIAVAFGHRFLPEARWLLVHLLLLGAMTNAIMVWSAHFAQALLKSAPASRRGEAGRLVLLNAGVLAVVAGVVGATWVLTLAGAVVLGGAVAAHGISLAYRARTALPSRFGASVRYYVAASAALPVGAALGTLLARHPDEAVHARLVLAHLAANVLGWVGLTVLGTLLTLWPTILRTRMAEGAERHSRRALPALVASLSAAIGGALWGARLAVAVAVAAYLAAALWSLRPMLAAARARAPQSYAAWSVLAAVAWLVVSLAWLAGLLALAPDWAAAGESAHRVAVPLAAGFALQVLLGALSYLLPVVRGGGPATVRATSEVLERGAALRVVIANLGLLLLLLPAPSLVRVLVSILVLAAHGSFVVLLPLALRAGRRGGAQVGCSRVRHVAEPRAEVRSRHTGMAAAGLSAVVLAVAVGVAADPAALGSPGSASAGVTPTGRTTTVRVEARAMRFHPSAVEVPAGNRLVVEVVNRDNDVHDLALETGQRTGRLSPGQTGRVEVDVVGRGLDGWCTIVGHRQMGMLLSVDVIGAASPVAHSHGSTSQGGGKATADPSAAAPVFMAQPPAGFTARDARLLPAPPGRLHRVSLSAREVAREVAVGVRQTLWTFNGAAPGPVLRGRVGDRFEITLRNDADLGHSIDFHAGSLAPDQPMRTLAPGQTLTYSFTATHAGVWMYHCSSMPMSLHIANGMFGAVVIDPPGLARADHEYLLVQSELYLGAQGATADPAKIATERPDAVVFNGFANQYDHDQLEARAGQRVRLWVLDAGPNRPSSFHVVGGQFDTVFSEGAYLLRPGAAGSIGGAQALALQPAQGGFIEMRLPEAGHYAFVSHLMVDAERGAHGILRVSR